MHRVRGNGSKIFRNQNGENLVIDWIQRNGREGGFQKDCKVLIWMTKWQMGDKELKGEV